MQVMVVVVGEISGQALGGASDLEQGFAPGPDAGAALVLQELVYPGVHLFQLVARQLSQFGNDLGRTHNLLVVPLFMILNYLQPAFNPSSMGLVCRP